MIGLVELDDVAAGIVDERLIAGADRVRRAVGLDVMRSQLGEALVEVVDDEREVVLTPRRLLVGGDEMHLLVAGLQPRAADAEVRAGRHDAEPEPLVELDRLGHVMRTDRDGLDTGPSHDFSLTPRRRRRDRWLDDTCARRRRRPSPSARRACPLPWCGSVRRST